MLSDSHGIRAIDAIIAATATENHLPLCSGNAKHFKAIEGLKFKLFKLFRPWLLYEILASQREQQQGIFEDAQPSLLNARSPQDVVGG